VHNAPWDELDTGRLGDSVTLLEGIDFIARTAGDRPWVINLSMGRHGEQHDGTTLIEQGLDAAIRSAPGRAICLSAGNYFDKHIHASGQLRPTQERTIIWEVVQGKPTNSQLEFWYSWQDKFEVTVRSPDGSIAARAKIGDRSKFMVGGKEVGNIYHRGQEPNNLDNHITIYLYEEAPTGEWEVTLIGADVIDGRYHAWVERDVSCPSCQAHLRQEDADPRSTTGTICNGRRTLAVGAYNKHDPEMRLGHFSSVGPTRDGRLKPDLCAPGVSVLAARSAPRQPHDPVQLLTRMSGTSMAAPHVTGTVALMFQAASRRLRIEETHNLLLQSARKVSIPEDIPERIGIGFLDIEEAVEAAAALRAAAANFKQTTVQSTAPARSKSNGQESDSESENGFDSEAAQEIFEGRSEGELDDSEISPYLNTFHRIASDITSAFEGGKTGTLNLYDLGIITYGKHQATLHSGTLYPILKRFTELSGTATSTAMAAYLNRVQARDETLREDSAFIALLKQAAKEPEMDRAQDEEFTRQYWEPAKRKAATDNIRTALGHAIYYDTKIQGGLEYLAGLTQKKLGGTPGQTIAGKEILEEDSLRAFVGQRIQWNLGLSANQKKKAAELNQSAQELEASAAADPAHADELKQQATELRKKAARLAANGSALEASSKKTRGPSWTALVESGDLNLYGGDAKKIYLKGKSGVVIDPLTPGATIDENTPAPGSDSESADTVPPCGCAHTAVSTDSSDDELLEAMLADGSPGERDGDPAVSRLSPTQQSRRQRDLVEAHRNPRPETQPGTFKPWLEGQVDLTESTDDRRSLLLWNFDIDGSYLKPEHELAIREAVAWIVSRRPAWRSASGGAGTCRIFVSGFASRTGARQHNEVLAKDREETTIAVVAAMMPADLASDCDRGGSFDAFWTDPAAGENARRRAVRLVLQTPALPPPKPIPLDQCGNLRVWIEAFIPGSVPGYTFTVPRGAHSGKTAIPCPAVATPVNPNCLSVGYLTDQRSFDDSTSASVRMRSIAEIAVAPPAFIRHPGFEHVTSGTTELDKSTGAVTCVRLADMTRCSFQNFRVVPDPAAPLSGNFFIKLSVVGAASDPCVNLAADIDYMGEISVFCAPRGGVVEVSFNGSIDSFPAFEMYASLNGVTRSLFRVPPPKGNTVTSLLGGTNTPITGIARFSLCRFPGVAPMPEFEVADGYAELAELADEIVSRPQRPQVSVTVMYEMLSRNGSAEALREPASDRLLSAAEVFDQFAYRSRTGLSRQLAQNFEVVGMPGSPLGSEVRSGDLRIQRAEGERAHVSVLAGSQLRNLNAALSEGLTPESRESGKYAQVVEGGVLPHTRADRFARQMTDSAGRLLNDILLLRLATAPPAVVTIQSPPRPEPGAPDPDSAEDDPACAPTAPLLSHSHVRRTCPSTSWQSDTAVSVMSPSTMNPGFVKRDDTLAFDSSLDAKLSSLLLDTPAYATMLAPESLRTRTPSPGDKIRVALVDLTGYKICKPGLAAWGSTTPIAGASTAKVSIVYAAWQLLMDLNEMARVNNIATAAGLRSQANDAWSGLLCKPDLDWLITFDESGSVVVAKRSARMEKHLKEMVDARFSGVGTARASELILRIGFEYIASVLWQSGLRHPTRQGLWIGRIYKDTSPTAKTDPACHTGCALTTWKNNPCGATGISITALSAATFFTLLAQRRLVNESSSTEIEALLSRACNFIPTITGVTNRARKCGLTSDLLHDAGLLEAGSRRYVLVCLTTNPHWGGHNAFERDMDQLIQDNNP
jgi:hypothetical protein